MNEILCVTTFNTICISIFDTKCAHYTMEIPHMFVEVLNSHKPNFNIHKIVKALTTSNKILMSYSKVQTTHNIVQANNSET
jgi:hypothetical protein